MAMARTALTACGRLRGLASRQLRVRYGQTLCLGPSGFSRQATTATASSGTTDSSSSRRAHRSLLTLAIETSCDDTCVAILEKHGPAARLLHDDKATSDSRKFRGIEPTVAVTGHTSKLAGLVDKALRMLPKVESNGSAGEGVLFLGSDGLRRKPDFISVTGGPGMTSALAVGLNTAKGLAVAWQVPLVIVHHMKAHALTPRLVHATGLPWPGESNQQQQQEKRKKEAAAHPAFPFLTLLVSGGHTQLVLSRSVTSHTMLAEAKNVAIGDMLDKCARAILPDDMLDQANSVMYAAELEPFAFPELQQQQQQQQGQANKNPYNYTPPRTRQDEIRPYSSPTHGWYLTPSLANRRDMAFDFSGLGGQVQAIARRSDSPPDTPPPDLTERRELAHHAMRLAFEHLASRVLLALDAMRAEKKRVPKTLVVSGGVAANGFLMHVLESMLKVRGYGNVEIVRPPAELCTDNAAMIAWAGMEMFESGELGEAGGEALEWLPRAKWPMEEEKSG
ncbi:hypothetical protein VTJ49DRAFT_3344 [Mycothermus thermophilus]|uniref:N(6)-L-threonylcarbamoyladenine synthase n=1 Tax=Humicola insolens TaxID=85995 RepID=A0ABR3VMB4_HUMIN